MAWRYRVSQEKVYGSVQQRDNEWRVSLRRLIRPNINGGTAGKLILVFLSLVDGFCAAS